METGIDPDRVMAILQEPLRQQPKERGAYVRSACDGDHELYRELADALQWEERMGNFLLEPLMDFTLLVRPFEPGQTIGDGRFEILREIGEGGMGVVYEAFDRKLQQQIAIKAAKPGFQRLLSPELKAALKVRHQNICLVNQIHTAQTEYGEVDFLAMELLEGETLTANLAKAGKLSHEEALEIACQVCAGLAEAHRSGIIHRDLKSGNVILCNNEDGSRRAVITDFGLAGGTAITSGEVAGTPAYMAPELWRGEPPSKASDIYALGIMLYEMVAGRRPYQAEGSNDELGTTGPLLSSLTQEQWQHRAYTKPPPPPSTFVKHLDPRWDRVIRRCLQPLPANRPEASKVLSELQRKHLPKALFVGPALLILALAALVGLVGPVRQRVVQLLWKAAVPEIKEQQLTANPVEDSVNAAAVSPDGRYIAYQDRTGFYLRSIETGETRPITLPAAMRNRIYHLCWLPDGEKVLADVEGPNASFDTWVITILGGSELRQLYRHALTTGISPDGRMIAFTTGEFGRPWKELRVGGINGEAPRKLITAGEQEQLFSPIWSPDGRWIAYGRIWETAKGSWSSAIEVLPANGGPAKTLVAETMLPESDTLSLGVNPWVIGGWSADWRLLFTVDQDLVSQLARTKYSLWEIHVDPRTTEAVGKPEQLTQWSAFAPRNLTMTSDGKRLSLLKERHWLDVYLSDLSPDGTFMKEPRRFTLDDRGSDARAWMRNSETILFDSQRNGKWEIFGQMVQESVAHMVIASSGNVYGGVVSPDGSWFLYWESESTQGGRLLPTSGASSASVRLMRQAIVGGSPQTVLEAHFDEHRHIFSCSSNAKASSPCVLGLIEAKDLVFYSVDPLQGKGRQLGRIEVFGAYEDWGLSPDGSRLALVDADKYEGRIELLTLADGTWHELAVKPKREHLQSIVWAADGKSFFATTYAPDSYNLLHITLGGDAQTVLHNDGRQWLVSPLPSPDGKYLAFDAQTWDSNIWLIDNF